MNGMADIARLRLMTPFETAIKIGSNNITTRDYLWIVARTKNRTCFNQQYLDHRILCQSVGKYCTCRACTGDDEIIVRWFHFISANPKIWAFILSSSISDFSRTARSNSSASFPTGALMGASICSEISIIHLLLLFSF